MTTQVDHTAYINAMISCCGRRTRARGSAFGSARSTAALSQSSPARAFTGEVARSSAPEADQTSEYVVVVVASLCPLIGNLQLYGQSCHNYNI